MGEIDSVISIVKETIVSGGTLLYPTDTIWGIGCDATNADAVEKIYAVKQRDHSKSMLVLCSDIEMVERFVGEVSEMVREELMSEDRPTTVIMPVGADLMAGNLKAADGTIGVRIPRMDFCQRMLGAFGRPVVSTSANLSGQPSPNCFAQIDESIKKAVDYVVPAEYEIASNGQASRIVKFDADGAVTVIRS